MNQIARYAHNDKVTPNQFWVEYQDGTRRESTLDENVSLWFVWASAPGSTTSKEGDFTVYIFSPTFLKENHLYGLVKRKDEDRQKYFDAHP